MRSGWLGVAVLALGCGPDWSEDVSASVFDTDFDVVEPQRDPGVRVDIEQLGFAGLELGESETRQVMVSSVGEATLSLESLVVAPASGPFSIPDGLAPDTLAPGTSVTVPITFSPRREGEVTGSLTVRTDDPTSPQVTVILSGRGLPPPEVDLRLSPAALDFGAVTLGRTAERSFTLSNAGGQDGTLNSLVIDTSAATFGMIDPPTTPLTLPAGGSVALTFTYTPDDLVEDRATLRLTTDDPRAALLTGDLTGTGFDGVCDPDGTPFGGGGGTEGDPYLLCDDAHLRAIRDHSASHFALDGDIVMDSARFVPIPTLSGSLDGRGFTVQGLRIVESGDAAFVLILEEGAEIRDLRLDGLDVTGRSSVAGLVRSQLGRIEDVHITDATITATSESAGGMVSAQNATGVLVDSSFEGAVDAGTGFGAGLVNNAKGRIERVVVEGSVTARDWKVGGVVHILDGGTIRQAVSRADLTAINRVGGIVATLANGGVIEDCYAEGAHSGEEWIGGLVGETWRSGGTIRTSYSNAELTATKGSGSCTAGGLVGCNQDSVTVTASGWESTRAGTSSSPGGGTSLTASELRDPSTSLFSTWGSAWVHSSGSVPRLAHE